MVAKKTIPSKKTKTTLPKKEKASVKGISVHAYEVKGDEIGMVKWPVEPDKEKVHPKLMAQAMRVYLANTHQGTVATKTRGEVTGSTRKIYRQKGTGRARHGDIKAPIFVGGGITFGPRPRSVKRDLPQKMRRQVLTALLSDKAKAGKLLVISGFDKATGKTREMAALCASLGLKGKPVLVVLGSTHTLARQGFRNIEMVEVTQGASVSPLSVVKCDSLLMSQEAIEHFKD